MRNEKYAGALCPAWSFSFLLSPFRSLHSDSVAVPPSIYNS